MAQALDGTTVPWPLPERGIDLMSLNDKKAAHRGAFALVAVLALLVSAAPANAQAQGSLDVFLKLIEGLDPGPDLAGYDVMLSVVPPSVGVTLTNAAQTDPLGLHPPIFTAGNPIVYSNTGDSIRVSDFLTIGGEEVEDDDGLCRILFQTDPTATGTFAVQVNLLWTNLADEQGDPLGYTAEDGSVVVENGDITAIVPAALTIIPEPGGCLLLIAGAAAVLRRKRRRCG